MGIGGWLLEHEEDPQRLGFYEVLGPYQVLRNYVFVNDWVLKE